MATELIVHPEFTPAPASRALAKHKMAMLIRSVNPWGGLQDRIELMPVNRKVTSGLAWAGLLLVVGVPSADFVTAQMGTSSQTSVNAALVGVTTPSSPAPLAPAAPVPVSEEVADVPPTETPEAVVPEVAAVAPMETAEPTSADVDVVDQYLAGGRELPAYLSDGTAQEPVEAAELPAPGAPVQEPVIEPLPVVAQTPEADVPLDAPPGETAVVETVAPGPQVIIHEPRPQEVASLPQVEVPPELPAPVQLVAPEPMPLSMRPAAVERPTPPAVERTTVASTANPEVVLPADRQLSPAEEIITAEDLRDWESGPLSEFLEQRRQGFSAPNRRDDRGIDEEEYVGEYDDEGFFYEDERNRRNRGKSSATFGRDGFGFVIY